MELTLTSRWIEYKQNKVTKELSDNIEIEYYGNSLGGIRFPPSGIIKYIDGVYMIIWDDIEENTIIDDSDHCKKILVNCGFK